MQIRRRRLGAQRHERRRTTRRAGIGDTGVPRLDESRVRSRVLALISNSRVGPKSRGKRPSLIEAELAFHIATNASVRAVIDADVRKAGKYTSVRRTSLAKRLARTMVEPSPTLLIALNVSHGARRE